MHRSTGLPAYLPLVLIPVLLLGAQVAGAARPPAASSATARARVAIANFTFLPRTLRVRAGTTVTWSNTDTNVGHTVTSGDGTDTRRWKSSGVFFGGQRFSVTFRVPGTYRYYCMPHYYNPGMHGIVIVTR